MWIVEINVNGYEIIPRIKLNLDPFSNKFV
jgi:hypothetical protein